MKFEIFIFVFIFDFLFWYVSIFIYFIGKPKLSPKSQTPTKDKRLVPELVGPTPPSPFWFRFSQFQKWPRPHALSLSLIAFISTVGFRMWTPRTAISSYFVYIYIYTIIMCVCGCDLWWWIDDNPALDFGFRMNEWMSEWCFDCVISPA